VDDDDPDHPGSDTFYADTDDDGFGDPDEAVMACEEPEGYVDNDEDCDDTEEEINPEATEVCNGRDDDCDGLIDTPCNILIYSADEEYPHYSRDTFTTLASVLTAEGHTVTVTDRGVTPIIEPSLLEEIGQFWLLATDYDGSPTSTNNLSEMEVETIRSFIEAGGRIYISSDHSATDNDYTVIANQIANLFGVSFHGNFCAFTGPITTVVEHPILAEVTSLCGHCSTSELNLLEGSEATIVATYAPGLDHSVVLETDSSRLVFDVSFVPLTNACLDGASHGDTARYAENIANWLAEL